MNAYDLVLAVLANEPNGRMLGRTSLQKKVFFLKEMISAPIRFFPHHYGPYSREIAEAVDSLVSAGILKETVESFPSFQTPWGESTRYSYNFPGNIQSKIIFILEEGLGERIYSKIRKALKKINDCPEAKDYKSLSIAAKVLQILNEKGEMKVNDFPKEAKKLRWNLNTNDVKKAATFIKGIGLLKEEE
jgi:uncharacterized protein YwgA